MILQETIGMSPGERKDYLESNASKITEGVKLRDLTPEELNELRIKFAEESMNLESIESEASISNSQFKSRINQKADQCSALLSKIRHKKEPLQGRFYEFHDHEKGKVNVYAETGEFIEQRDMMPSERQTTMKLKKLPNAKKS